MTVMPCCSTKNLLRDSQRHRHIQKKADSHGAKLPQDTVEESLLKLQVLLLVSPEYF